jgi:ATP-binding cassette subfamily F protein uup
MLLANLDLLIARGDKLALIGPNGCGKSSLIKLLLGDIEPVSGDIHRGVNLEIAYFDQHRSQLDLDQPLIDAIADGKREVTVNGAPRHVISYLQDYLFSPERVNAPVSTLSGGERNRLMLAKLMLKPSNLLILDEPTNDLDVETLELLESLIVEYSGTVLLVSHDREFIDNVVTSSLVFEGQGEVTEFVGGYSDAEAWYKQSAKSKVQNKPAVEQIQKVSKPIENKATQKKVNTLSYQQRRDLESLPKQIEKLESDLQGLQLQVNDADFFQQASSTTQAVLDQLQACESALELAFKRWEELEELKNNQ